MNVFGTHHIPVNFKHAGFSLSFEKEGKNYLYKREAGNEKIEKLILGKKKQILIHPIEPVTKPKIITPHLLLKLKRSIIFETKISKIVYLKFPVELGVFLSLKKKQESIDFFTLTNPKFTLYGDPRSGVICKYYESDIYSTLPTVDFIQEGVLELKLVNRCPEWVEIKKVLLDAHNMNIYYDHKMAFMRAEMEVQNPTAAETGFIDSPYNEEMEKSIQVFSPKKIHVGSNRFMMREGF